MLHFVHSVAPDGLDLQLLRGVGLLRKSHLAVKPTEWVNEAPLNSRSAVARLSTLADGDSVRFDDDCVRLKHSAVATLTESQATSLGLPGAPPYTALLEHIGTFDQADFRFALSWRSGHNSVVAHRIGSILRVGGRDYRLDIQLFQLCEAIDAFNAEPPHRTEERFLHWATIRPFVVEQHPPNIAQSPYLRTTHVAHATRFSINILAGQEGPILAPVLFDPADEDDLATPTELDGLLPPLYRRRFSEERFPSSEGCRSQYGLGDGWYLVIDEELRAALTELRRIQNSDAATRWAFARNPISVLRERIGGQLSDDVLDKMFVVTDEYSKRVVGTGLWQKPVVPWVQMPGNDWLPSDKSERLGIKVGNDVIQLSPPEISALTEEVEKALSRGALHVTFNGHTIPAQAETLNALRSLTGFVRPGPAQTMRPECSHQDRQVLLVESNLDELGFSRTLVPRTSRAPVAVPAVLRTSLMPHQIASLEWMQAAWLRGVPGVLLADDMGLGKTIQALSMLGWLREATPERRPFLIVAPTGLLSNWEKEASEHLRPGALSPMVAAYGGRRGITPDSLREANCVLTTYETLRDQEALFAPIRFSALVFDEMQKIKSPDSLLTNCAKNVNADFVLGLTGTPVENRLADLWCLMDRVWDGWLGELKSFSRRYEGEGASKNVRELKRQLMEPSGEHPAVLLRRMKNDHLPGLPKANIYLLRSPMPTEQASQYSEIAHRGRNSKERGAMLETLQGLRSVSLHPLHPDQVGVTPDDSYIAQSARLVTTFQILDRVSKGKEKALVFLEHLAMQDYLADVIQRRYFLKQRPMLINGAVAGMERQRRVNDFQESSRGFDVMILSPKAGGVGLTLTAANHVIHLSRWWNPAVEDQCSDRVYRIGQRNPIHIYYPIAEHPNLGTASFDIKLHELLDRKRRLSRELLLPAAADENDLRDLFSATTGISLTRTSAASMPIPDICAMDGRQFERWTAQCLRESGWHVRLPPKSHDGGADVVAERAGRRIVVQCKHRQNDHPLDDAGIESLLKARERYEVGAGGLVLITSAQTVAARVNQRANQNGIKVFSRSDLNDWVSGL